MEAVLAKRLYGRRILCHTCQRRAMNVKSTNRSTRHRAGSTPGYISWHRARIPTG
ncbi:hypothetical protein ASZ90_014726 [hydrocarbon metagenome]|uniref:Uncharacterized protein n=1 Tax=hydrocarbon metagenome TaxID=938273 RepID=A0A0W8F430_9ZZZZ